MSEILEVEHDFRSHIENALASRILPLLGLGAAAGLGLRSQPPRRKPPAWRGVKSGVESASKGVMSGAAARLQQNSLRKASQHKVRLYARPVRSTKTAVAWC